MLAAVLLLPSLAAAQPDEATDPDTEVAAREFNRGGELYEQRRYTEAIAAFERAKAIRPLPAFDYNIARCYDRLGQWQKAVESYRRYLAAAGDAKDAAETRARVEVLVERARQEEAQSAPPTTAPPPATATAPPIAAPPATTRRPLGRAKTIAGAVVLAAGVALAATGAAFGGLAMQAGNDVTARAQAHQTFDPARYQAGQNDQALEAALLAVGGAAAIAGTVVLILGRREAARARYARIAPLIAPGVAGASWQMRF